MNGLFSGMVLFSVMFLLGALPGAAAEPPKLTSLRDSWSEANQRDARPIKDKYLTSLKSLQKEFTKQGNLEHAVLVRHEIEVLTQGAKPLKAEAGKGSAKLDALRAVFAREMTKVFDRNTEKYRGALKALQRSFTKSGALESALSVGAELEKLSAVKVTTPAQMLRGPVIDFEKWLETVKFQMENGGYRYVLGKTMAHAKADGARQRQYKPRIIEIDSNGQSVTWKYGGGHTETFRVAPDRRSATWENSGGLTGNVKVLPRE